jgi:putative two-component system response regulator
MSLTTKVRERERRILIVDDDPQIIRVISKILKEDKVDVVSAANVKEAISIFENMEIDLVIIDYILTNGSGIDVIKHVRKQKPTLPIIMISGAGSTIRIPSLEHGANLYLDKPFNGKELRAIVLNMISLAEAHQSLNSANDMIVALSRAIESRDSYTEGHSQRVSVYALTLYDAAGYSEHEERAILATGCLLHDIGKIGVPDNILKSSERLTSEQYEKIKIHPEEGYRICKDLIRIQTALPIIRHHHEKLDGSGYPESLQEKDIPEIVQMVTIADIYDALTSDRAYRTQNNPKEAFEIMKKEVEKGFLNKYYLELFMTLPFGQEA